METLIQLNFDEQRVLGALIEKSITTPDHYPLTLNGLTTACNQKSARKPVVAFDEETVVMALDSLQKKGLTTTESGAYSRTTKYEHKFAKALELSSSQVAVLCLLLLRGPLTAGELKSNSGRLYAFDSLDEVHATLQSLREAQPPFIQDLPRQTGQKERRCIHLFAPVPEMDEAQSTEEPVKRNVSELEQRLSTVEEELAMVKEKLQMLLDELT